MIQVQYRGEMPAGDRVSQKLNKFLGLSPPAFSTLRATQFLLSRLEAFRRFQTCLHVLPLGMGWLDLSQMPDSRRRPSRSSAVHHGANPR